MGGFDATEYNDNAATQIAMFYFQQLFNTAMNGIDSGGATSGAVQVAQYILLASLLFGIYEPGRVAETLTSSERRRSAFLR